MSGWYQGASREERRQDAIRRHGLDALVALTPENAHYLAGHGNYIATHWRLPGLFSCAIGANGTKAVVTGDFGADPSIAPPWAHLPYRSWTESVDVRSVTAPTIQERVRIARPEQIDRPAQFWLDDVADRVAAAIRAVASVPTRIGLDLAEVDVASLARLQERLRGIELVDVTDIFDDLRAIKDPDEIGWLRAACELTEIGIAGAVARIAPGMSEAAVNAAYQVAVHEAVIAEPRFAGFRQAEGMANIGIGAGPARMIAPGTTVKFDMQVDMAGYHSDIGRTYAWQPTTEQRTIYAALLNALNAVAAALRPGRSFAEVYEIGREAMASAGFPAYSRGHLGHSDGLTQHFEEGPFIAPDEQRLIAPNMVLSIELPYYIYGVGAFQMERMALITDDGHELLDTLPFEFDLLTGVR